MCYTKSPQLIDFFMFKNWYAMYQVKKELHDAKSEHTAGKEKKNGNTQRLRGPMSHSQAVAIQSYFDRN